MTRTNDTPYLHALARERLLTAARRRVSERRQRLGLVGRPHADELRLVELAQLTLAVAEDAEAEFDGDQRQRYVPRLQRMVVLLATLHHAAVRTAMEGRP